MAIANPVSTDVHNNINDLIMKAEMDSKLKQYSMSAYKQPQPITGTAPDIALNPLLAAKKIPSLMKLLKKINLRNPIYHHTNIPKAEKILKTGKIKPTSSVFKGGDKLPKYSKEIDEFGNYIPIPKAFSVTRDPMFLSRPHFNIGTDVRFIMDRDELVRKGYKMKPFAEGKFRKSLTTDADFPFVKKIDPTVESVKNPEYYKKIYGKYPEQMNPKFEFEERILGNLPTKDIKLMDFAKTPTNFSTWKPALGKGVFGARRPQPELQNLIDTILDINQKSTQLPVIMSEQVRSTLKRVEPYLMDMYTKNNPDRVKALERLMSAPTYKYNPFKLKNK
tara:strand:+ start:803 stop:1804 length:1002 start_codon:yes stop_codon:yes gene_type:complete